MDAPVNGQVPPLPEGFTLDSAPASAPSPSASLPPLPPGFALDSAQQTAPAQPSAPDNPMTGAAASALEHKPGWTYGGVLPMARDPEGNLHLALPDMIREPILSALKSGNKLEHGEVPQVNDYMPAVMATVGAGIKAPTVAGEAIPTMAGTLKKGSSSLIAGSGPTPAAAAAHEAGFVVPPNMASKSPGLVSQGLSMLSGKIKLNQAASAANQEQATALSKQALGLPENTMLDDATFGAVRDEASKAYQKVASAVPSISTDLTFASNVRSLGKKGIAEAAKAFPGIVKNGEIENLSDTLASADQFSPQAGVELVRHLRSDATANLKSFNDPAKLALGLSQRQAAEEVDNLIERRLTSLGKPDLVNDYRDARAQIARSYDVEAATNPATGEVNARVLAALSKKGRPLSGQLKDIANAALAFPKAFQNAEAIGGQERMGVLDALVGITHPEVIPALIARPASRSALLSRPYQNVLMRNPGAGGGANVAPSALNNGTNPGVNALAAQTINALAAQRSDANRPNR